MKLLDRFAFKKQQPKRDKATAKSGGLLYSEQAVFQMNSFFNNLLRIDTDEVLRKAGIARHQLSVVLYDDEIDEKVERRWENLTQGKYTLSPSDGDIAVFVYQQLDKHLESILTASLNAKMYGYSVCELIWDKESVKNTGVIQVQKVTEKPMQWFEPKKDGKLIYFAEHTMTGVEVDTEYKFLLQQHKATYEEPKGKSLLSRVYWLWYFKKHGFQFWSKFLERFGTPLLVGKTDGETQDMANALVSAVNQPIVAIPKDDEVIAISASGNGEAFKSFDNVINRRIAKYLLGQTLTSGTDNGGTYGQAMVHKEQQQIVFDSDKKFALRYIQRFINLICSINGYDAPEFEWVNEKGLQKDRAQRDILLSQIGVKFDRQYFADNYDIDEDRISIVNSNDQLPIGNKFIFSKSNNSSKPKFTKEQQQIETLVDDLLDNTSDVIDRSLLIHAFTNSTDIDDLTENLYELVGKDISSLNNILDNVMMSADVIGYVHGKKKG